MEKRIWICRHGQSESNNNAPTDSPSGIILAPLGHEQAHKAALTMTEQPDVIMCSKMKRAVDTRQAIAMLSRCDPLL